jgi:hypothetical protein
MTQLEQHELGIGEEQVTASAPMVRALLVQRLEQIWAQCQPHVDGTVKPDPRFIEAGIRVLDRLARLYRLDSPLTSAGEPDADPHGTAISTARKQLEQMEARLGQE